jgi:hypothetical protein
MINLAKITDPYERKARLYPALICLFPLMVGISITFPKVYSTLSGFVALAAAIGGIQFLSHLARDRGKKLEHNLFTNWGGTPSVSILRHRDKLISPPAKLKYHSVLERKSKISAPSVDFENDNHEKADEIYTAWSDFLRGKTRDAKKYPLIFKENINYGFRRNLLGVRWHCISSAFIAIIIILSPSIDSLSLSENQIAIGLFLIVYLFIFLFVVSSDWVKTIADVYSRNLIEAINA